jgi:hypothetical protein
MTPGKLHGFLKDVYIANYYKVQHNRVCDVQCVGLELSFISLKRFMPEKTRGNEHQTCPLESNDMPVLFRRIVVISDRGLRAQVR